jgi:uncharacterized protein (DUF302 family)
MLRKIEIERFSIISKKPFDEVLAAISGGVGHPNMVEFWKSTKSAQNLAELENIMQKFTGSAGLMQFEELDHGGIIQKDTGHKTRMLRLLIGNPLIMKEMAKRIPDAGSYAPTTVLVDERADGVHLSYDRMASFLAPYKNEEALEVARTLDAKIEALLLRAAS